MQHRVFGTTGLTVSALGFGAGQIGVAAMDEATAGHLLNLAADLGVTLFDTARGYGTSEERIGRHLAHRRDTLVLSTKVGYGIEGHEDWTYGCVAAGIDAALRRLATDRIDIVHLHSCPLETLERGEVIEALTDAMRAGKVRATGYSGDNAALDHAVDDDRFLAVEHSLNICDQRVIDGALARAQKRGLGVIAKRPVANAPWQFAERPTGDYAEEYWWRWRAMAIDPRGLDWQELALRFTAFTPGVHSCLVGTRHPDHLRKNVELVARGPLPDDHVAAIRAAFQANDPGWWRGET